MGVNRCYTHSWENELGWGECPYCAQINATNRVAEAIERNNPNYSRESTFLDDPDLSENTKIFLVMLLLIAAWGFLATFVSFLMTLLFPSVNYWIWFAGICMIPIISYMTSDS